MAERYILPMAIEPVRRGDGYARQCDEAGSAIRDHVPHDGILVRLEDRDLFIPATELALCLARLGYTVVCR